MSRRACLAGAALSLAVFVVAGSWGPDRTVWAPLGGVTADDPRLAAVVRALPGWREALRSSREVVDVVGLVPDEAAFLEALTTWSSRSWFPILIEDPELVLRFLRAFRPARIVRWPTMASGGEARDRRSAILAALEGAWDRAERYESDAIRAVSPEGATGPGIVLISERSPAWCGGVALAAGRRQPLVFWDCEQPPEAVLSLAEALDLCAEIAQILEQVAGPQLGLGDRADFVTLATQAPDRYQIPSGDKAGEAALDDLLGRSPLTLERLAYTGRLIGPPPRAVYQAMASLFLRPESALLFNTYPERTPPWDAYRMDEAAGRLGAILPTRLVQGRRVDWAGWHRVFDPVNASGLVFINSSGGPDQFRLRGGRGRTADIPLSVPAAVLAIHSFSAARPEDEKTLAGRWLANGAFVYFGAMNEPYLAAFRTPGLVAELLAAGAPWAAAVCKLMVEDATGSPWRLRVLGDPLYQIYRDPEPGRRDWLSTLDALEVLAVSGPDRREPSLMLRRCRDRAYLDAAAGRDGSGWAEHLAAIDRVVLDPRDRSLYDALLADQVARGVLLDQARRVPEVERAPALRRALEAVTARPDRP